jgi:hypothetical protein
MLTMLLGGLWHGALELRPVGFLPWVCAQRSRVMTVRSGPASDGRLAAALKICGFGLVTLYGWLLFRAESFDQIASFTATLFTAEAGSRSRLGCEPLGVARHPAPRGHRIGPIQLGI